MRACKACTVRRISAAGSDRGAARADGARARQTMVKNRTRVRFIWDHSFGRQAKGENVGLFSSKAKAAPIPIEDRPIEYVRFPKCRHDAYEDCECYSWDVWLHPSGVDPDAHPELLPVRRDSTKRTLVLLPDHQEDDWQVQVYSLANEPLGVVGIPREERQWAVSHTTRIVYQVWLIITRGDMEGDEEKDYQAFLRFADAGRVDMYDEGDPVALVHP